MRRAEPETYMTDRDGRRWLSIDIDYFRERSAALWPGGAASCPADIRDRGFMSGGAVYLAHEMAGDAAATWLAMTSHHAAGQKAEPGAWTKQAAFSVANDLFPLDLDRVNAGFAGARIQFNPDVGIAEHGLSGQCHIDSLDEFVGWDGEGATERHAPEQPFDNSGFLVRNDNGATAFVPAVGAVHVISIEPIRPAFKNEKTDVGMEGP